MHILEIEIASITLAKETPQSILIWQKKEFAVPTLLCWDHCWNHSLPTEKQVYDLRVNCWRLWWPDIFFPLLDSSFLWWSPPNYRWRESSNKCTDSVNVRVHQAKWMVPTAKWSGTAFCHHSPPIRPSLDPFLLHIFSAEYKLPGNILYFKVLAYQMFFLQAISVCFLVDCQFMKQHLPFLSSYRVMTRMVWLFELMLLFQSVINRTASHSWQGGGESVCFASYRLFSLLHNVTWQL